MVKNVYLKFVLVVMLGFVLPAYSLTGVLRVCTTGDYPPLTQLINGGYQGQAIVRAHELANYLGMKLEFVKTTWPSLAHNLVTNQCDIAMGGISKTPAREQAFLITSPVAKFGKVPLVRCSDVAKYSSLKMIDQPNVKVVENAGGTNALFAKQHLQHAKIIVVQNNTEPFNYLLENKADVMFTDNIEAVYRQKIMPGLCAVNPSKPLNTAYKVYMLPKNKERLLAKVDRWLNENHYAI